MAQLRLDHQQFLDRGAVIIAVGPETAEDFKSFWESRAMPFSGIPDPKHVIANMYGQQVDIFKLGRMPAMFIIDKAGKIRYRHYGKSMSNIPPDADILGLLDNLNKETQEQVLKPADKP
jgi:peroxiredoxin Q/BCP